MSLATLWSIFRAYMHPIRRHPIRRLISCTSIFRYQSYFTSSKLVMFSGDLLYVMHRSPVALPLCLVLLSPTWFQARASPIPRNFHPLKDSPWGCLTVILVLALVLTILFIFKKIYIARRRKHRIRSTIAIQIFMRDASKSVIIITVASNFVHIFTLSSFPTPVSHFLSFRDSGAM